MGVTVVLDIVAVECGVCGFWHGLPASFLKSRLEDGKVWYCPIGHTIGYGDNEHDRTRKQRDALLAQLDQEKAARREASERAEKAEKATARVKRRAVAGACQVCQRTFSNVARHMAHKHPEAVKEARSK